MRTALITLAATLALSTNLSAQDTELVPLETAIKDGATKSFISVRCSALFVAMAKTAGKDTLGEKSYNALQVSASNFAQLAINMDGAASKAEFDQKTKIIFGIVTQISDQYTARFAANETDSGHAWKEDAMWGADFQLCTRLSQQL